MLVPVDAPLMALRLAEPPLDVQVVRRQALPLLAQRCYVGRNALTSNDLRPRKGCTHAVNSLSGRGGHAQYRAGRVGWLGVVAVTNRGPQPCCSSPSWSASPRALRCRS